jgi:Ca2+-binding RTX toxin-like protein
LYGTTFNYAQINAIYLALFNREAEKAGLEYWYAKVADKTYTPAGAAMAILNGAQNADKTAVENKLAASAAFTAALDTASEMIGYSGDAAAASARAFLSTVTSTAATTAAVDAAVVALVAAKTAVSGQTFTLTANTDAFFGGTSNDRFEASPTTLSALDTLNGGAGDDTLSITSAGTAAVTTTSFFTTAIEELSVTASLNTSTDDTTINMALASSVGTLKSYGSTSDVAFTNVAGLKALKFASTSGTGTTSIAYTTSTVAGSADAQAISLESSESTGLVTIAGVETVAITATGSSTVNVLAAAATSVTVNATGTTTVDLDDAGNVALTSVNGSASTGNVTYNLDFSATELSFTGGAGNDTVVSAVGFTGTDKLDAGAGDKDVLSIRATADVAAVGALNATTLAAVATGFDTLDLRSADNAGADAVDITVDMDVVPGVSAITMRVADATDKAVFTLNDMTQAQAENLSVLHTGTDADTDSEIIVDMKTNGTDTVKLTATVTVDSQVVELNDANDNIENAEITLKGAFTTNLDVDVTSFLTSLKVSGGAAEESLVITNAHTSAIFDMSAVASAVTVTLGTGTQTVTTGSGKDIVTMGTGKKTVNLGAGDDTLNTTVALLGTATASWDTIVGGDGTDTLVLTTLAAVSGEAALGISGFERLKVSDAAAALATINMGAFSDAISRITVGDTNDALPTFSNVPLSFSDLRFDGDAEADTEAALTRIVDTSSNALTVTMTGGETVKELTLDNEELLTFTSSNTDAVTITTLNAADVTTLTLTGSGNVIFTNGNAIGGATLLATVDASNLAAAATVNATNSTVAITATANALSGGVFTFTGGSGSDIITGGVANDILSGGNGADTISGGAGTDTITGGAGKDTITGGTGSDTYVYAAATVATHGGDTLSDFAANTNGDEIEIDIAIDAAVSFAEIAADALEAGQADNADVFVVTGRTVVDVSGDAAADLAALNALIMDAGADSADADAEILVVVNADSDGDGSSDQIQVWWLHETTGANSTFDAAALVGVISTISANADLASDFVAANFDFT